MDNKRTDNNLSVLLKSLLTLSLRRLLCLLITFASSLDPDQDRQNVGSDLDRNCLTL